jgi:adenylate cyclase class 2
VAAIIEREIKLRFGSPDEAREAILATGATPLRGRRLQEDCVLDDRDQSLGRRGCVLRVRIEAGKSQLTFKGPVQSTTMKVREELETMVGDGEILMRVLGELGLQVCFRYEKYREEFALDDLIVALDETPVGTFVELEGGEEGIAHASEALGRTAADFLVDSYRAIFSKHCTQQGLPVRDMVFGEP